MQAFSPSSTRVLSDLGMTPGFDALPNQAAIAHARDRGHRIHAVVEAELTQRSYNEIEHANDASQGEIVRAFEVCDWLHRNGYTEIVSAEQRRWHSSKGYNGKADLFVRKPSTNRIVNVDLKTGTMRCAGHAPQAASYVELYLDELVSNGGQRQARTDVGIVLLYAGEDKIEPIAMTPIEHIQAWMAFDAALHVWWWRYRAGMLPKGER